jgi:hypothetical protein
MARKLRHGEALAPDAPPVSPELVEVRHPELDLTQIVRRDRLSQMDPAWQIVADEQPVTPDESTPGSDKEKE